MDDVLIFVPKPMTQPDGERNTGPGEGLCKLAKQTPPNCAALETHGSSEKPSQPQGASGDIARDPDGSWVGGGRQRGHARPVGKLVPVTHQRPSPAVSEGPARACGWARGFAFTEDKTVLMMRS